MPACKIIKEGTRFGKLVVCGSPVKIGAHYKYPCMCDCGGSTISIGSNLRNNSSKSCGCARVDTLVKNSTKHGMAKSRIYVVWSGMKARCENEGHISYPNYGGRGIIVVSEFKSFSNFHKWAIRSGYKDGLSLDRISSDGPYSPENCRWVNWTTQNRNSRRNHSIYFSGRELCVEEWSEVTGIRPSTIRHRLKRGWPIWKALTIKT